MKTQGYFLILLTFFPWILEAQPLADLSGMRVGDSVGINVSMESQKEYTRENGELSYLKSQAEIYTYTIFFLNRKGENFRFQARLDRIRYTRHLRYEGNVFHKRNEHYDFDTDFDTEKAESSKVNLIGSSIQFIVNKQNHRILQGENKDVIYYGSEINPAGIRNHINAIFFVQRYPVQDGSISAKLLSTKKKLPVRISGKIKNASSKIISISSNPERDILSPLSQNIRLDSKGNFQTAIELSTPGFLYFYYEKSVHEITRRIELIKIPVYLEPGDDLNFTLDIENPQSMIFSGQSAPKFEIFHDLLSKFFIKYNRGERDDNSTYLWAFRGLELTKATLFSQMYTKFMILESFFEDYNTILNYLEVNRKALGDNAYYAIKTEVVYSFAIFNLASNISERIKKEEISIPSYEFPNLSKLTLSKDRGYYLDSLGLRLEEVKNSYAYPSFLAAYLNANSLEMKAPNYGVDRMMGSYYLARFAYEGFALQCYLKNNISFWLGHPRGNYLRETLGMNNNIEEGRKLIISQFKELCKHKAFLEEVSEVESIFLKLKKGEFAPNLILSKLENSHKHFGQKLALVFFYHFVDSRLTDLNNLAKDNPEVKFVFLNYAISESQFQRLTSKETFEGSLFHSPGHGSNEDRPYFVSNPYPTFYLIDQEGKLWGSETSKANFKEFAKEVNLLNAYQINHFIRIWNSYKEQILLISISFLSFLTILGIYWFVFIRSKRQRNRQKMVRIETELRAIRSQMNPHFLFNSLSSVQNLINQSDKEKANHYLSRFSQLIRKVLNHSEQAMIPLEDELKVVDLYCELEALRFKFDYKIEVDSGIDAHTMEIPSMLIQPYVENSVRHGLATQGGAGFIGVFVRKMEGFIQITVEDNGIGIRKHMEEFAGHIEKSGFGLRLSDQRVLKINERYNMNIEVKIFDRRDDAEPSHGTRVVVRIPDEE